MDIIFDLFVVFSDKITQLWNRFSNFSPKLELASPLSDECREWLCSQWKQKLQSDKLENLLVCVHRTRRNKFRISVKGLNSKGNCLTEILSTFKDEQVPSEFQQLKPDEKQYYQMLAHIS